MTDHGVYIQGVRIRYGRVLLCGRVQGTWKGIGQVVQCREDECHPVRSVTGRPPFFRVCASQVAGHEHARCS